MTTANAAPAVLRDVAKQKQEAEAEADPRRAEHGAAHGRGRRRARRRDEVEEKREDERRKKAAEHPLHSAQLRADERRHGTGVAGEHERPQASRHGVELVQPPEAPHGHEREEPPAAEPDRAEHDRRPNGDD